MEKEEERPENHYQIIIRSVVEQVHVVTATDPVSAELKFEKMREDGLKIPGVIQSRSIEKMENLLLDGFEVSVTTAGEGCPSFWTVVHTESGLRKTKPSLKAAYNKVKSDLARRGISVHPEEQ